MSRGTNLKDGVNFVNAGSRSGAFSTDKAPDDDGVLGDRTFVPLWSGVRDLDGLTEAIPAASGLVLPGYFHDTLPYNWS